MELLNRASKLLECSRWRQSGPALPELVCWPQFIDLTARGCGCALVSSRPRPWWRRPQ